MIQRGTIVKVADNSGAKEAKLIGIPGASKVRYARINDVVVVSIQKTTPNTGVKDHEVHKAVIIRTTKELRRKDGTYVRFDDNAVVLIDPKNKTPKGTRIFGPVARELKEGGFDKILSLAPEVL
ncbi:MAG TPA: 50S ribosomal protein L14 [Candidatus Dojkabacteria bacterium]|jgi:large subunit ribosomal protein L14|uniref:Large ribosomal subunit protein uL14 n=1 Tax=Candidatus Dojkabacteria bacterium TaxID=2099670 RepID=A0A847CYV3_9BACT|nr:50S ribosomal protein L14 [Candidatus Dojkabacteria bacterium]NLD25347.1 50S ribosomal protein L14 [Candidatus Dojkabacteria bacterium]HQC39101.1 50S ribosomal protein L14 [Candidatus Dojkabacteria bacterium]HRY74392.1 50S ribosomal protein L14 [Candidatus Dojkabacteria bacterium]HRZ84660.1 50S ribosomal protein L14 [Candidatus Dojkabacteria bacterium]